jgi:proline iminopeptidase
MVGSETRLQVRYDVNMNLEPGAQMVSIGDTNLYVVVRGTGFPLIVLHGGPGMDHHEFADYLDSLTNRFKLILVDQRGQGRSDPASENTLTLAEMSLDISRLAKALRLEKYAVLGHSFGAFVALGHAIRFPGATTATILSNGLPSARYLEHVAHNLEVFEPLELREQVAASWARETDVQTHEEMAELMRDQMPFHFANPLDPRIAEFEQRSAQAKYAPDVLRYFSSAGYGGIEVKDQLHLITQPVLVLAGRHDRTCVIEGAEAMARGIPRSKLVVFENSAHMPFVEEQEAYLNAIRGFLEPLI